jgi:MFS family permease
MYKLAAVIAIITCAITAAVISPLLVGLLGWLLCRLMVTITGNPNLWDWMWPVYVIAMAASPLAFLAVLWVSTRIILKRERQRKEQDGVRGFEVLKRE